MDQWCHEHNFDKDIYLWLEVKFFEDLVNLCFNPGGPVGQFHTDHEECQCLHAVHNWHWQEVWPILVALIFLFWREADQNFCSG